MDIDGMLRSDSRKFIEDNQYSDPVQLLLKKSPIADVTMAALVSQIKGRRIISKKIPEWVRYHELVFPAPTSMEQSSSQATAVYKSLQYSGSHLVDLTGGLGVDSYFLGKNFDRVTYVEKSPELCELARHNFKVLGANHIQVVCGDCQDILASLPQPVDLIYMDPARRQQGQKVFRLEQCEPQILSLMPLVWEKTHKLCLKLSPLLDLKYLHDAVPFTTSMEVVAVNNDCKEILLHAVKDHRGTPQIRSVELSGSGSPQVFQFSLPEESQASAIYGNPQNYLYEPYSCVLKAGAFKTLCQRFKVQKFHANSHLYTSTDLVGNFPGRIFVIKWSMPYRPQKIREKMGLQANISVRNFPYSVKEIRENTGLQDGGSHYLFATTLQNGKPVVICGTKTT
ncbi:MAG: class I SAM-dependent methyltransferase [Cyclobacteriaceae bacterium]|nr:class I SAM-dependent methyltransferase [Cyclobacteriaceae bacterium]